MKKFFKYVILYFLLVSCTKEVYYDFPGVEPTPVLFCYFTDNKPFEVYLSLSIGVSDTNFTSISNAMITIYENNELFDTLTYAGTGKYIGTKIPTISNNYKVIANCPGYKTLTAEDYLPNIINIEGFEMKVQAGVHQWGDYYSEAALTFTDENNMPNYYEISSFLTYFYEDYDGNFISDTLEDVFWEYNITDPVLLAEDIFDYDPVNWIFNDKLIDGETYSLKIPYDYLSDFEQNSELTIYLYAVSENYYNFKKSLIKHLFNQGGREFDFAIYDIGNPVALSTNIENGYGAFLGYARASKTILIVN